MNENKLIMLQSITYATKARNVLLKHGINSNVVKTPKVNNQSTCGYSLSVPYRGEEAVNILLSKGFKIIGAADSDIL